MTTDFIKLLPIFRIARSAGGTTNALVYQGTWDANANNPAIVSGTGVQGHYYVVGTAGATNIDGISDRKGSNDGTLGFMEIEDYVSDVPL